MPRQSYINNNIQKLGLENINFGISLVEGFFNRSKNKLYPKNNKVEDLESYLGGHLYAPTIDRTIGFFGFGSDYNNKPIIGND
ncbi:unnamed protein product [Brachionus calyciflorus]|uniref:Uncharacterized protein n=1 Tax=Brachionus calyciflorus TaxID=104777 RepID=A0A814K7A5_9BILA|nr:unnamed protein product [Brachionus calyciflorus]